jgi:hypothetical protein
VRMHATSVVRGAYAHTQATRLAFATKQREGDDVAMARGCACHRLSTVTAGDSKIREPSAFATNSALLNPTIAPLIASTCLPCRIRRSPAIAELGYKKQSFSASLAFHPPSRHTGGTVAAPHRKREGEEKRAEEKGRRGEQRTRSRRRRRSERRRRRRRRTSSSPPTVCTARPPLFTASTRHRTAI